MFGSFRGILYLADREGVLRFGTVEVDVFDIWLGNRLRTSVCRIRVVTLAYSMVQLDVSTRRSSRGLLSLESADRAVCLPFGFLASGSTICDERYSLNLVRCHRLRPLCKTQACSGGLW